jgi:glycosyltransferase involved in cell wall biosynthesis
LDKSKTTVLHLLSHRPNPVCLRITSEEYIKKHDNVEFTRIDKFPYWVGFFQDFNHLMAKNILKITDKYNHECWRPYFNNIDKSYEKMFDGILHKVYPSKRLKIPKAGEWVWSESFLKDLQIKIKSGEKIIIHVHDGHSNFITWLLLKLNPVNIPIIYQQRGGWLSIYGYKYKRKNPIYLFTYKKQKNILKYFSHYYSISKIELDFLKNELKMNNVSNYIEGTDFDYFVPGNKIEMRKKLNLPLDKKIILYVGRFDITNGVDNLIKLRKRFIENKYDVELLLVGGYKQNSSYQLAKDAGAILVERVHESKLRDYYQAADIYSRASDDYFYRSFSGFGIAPIQALACGIPVLSYTNIHFPGAEAEMNKIGRIFKSDEELYQNALYMLNNPDEFKDCREIAKKYYDEKITIKEMVDKYDELSIQYYK